jgi:hypothetical protein
MHPEGLPADLPERIRVGDLFRSGIHVTQTARRQPDSRLLASLQNA